MAGHVVIAPDKIKGALTAQRQLRYPWVSNVATPP
jgi:hypothetical protein